jgi:hypothetical protein
VGGAEAGRGTRELVDRTHEPAADVLGHDEAKG